MAISIIRNGKKYYLESTSASFSSKALAKERAQNKRKKGWMARIAYSSSRRGWGVYVRKSSWK